MFRTGLRQSRMDLAKLCVVGVLGLSGVTGTGAACHGQELVAAGSTWKWWHSDVGVDPASDNPDFHTTFSFPEFDDSQWKEGKDAKGPTGGFGYGGVADAGFDGVNIGQPTEAEDRKTAYFRIKFMTTEDFEKLTLKCQRDDGFIAYIDGDEVVRDNVDKDADEAYDLFANSTISGDGEKKLNSFSFDYDLDAGEHVLAIALHNRDGGSSDLRIAEISLSVGGETDKQVDGEVAEEADAGDAPVAAEGP